jgi:protein gp37
MSKVQNWTDWSRDEKAALHILQAEEDHLLIPSIGPKGIPASVYALSRREAEEVYGDAFGPASCWAGVVAAGHGKSFPDWRRVMAETTAISWTDATFNPWWGCTRVSPGCERCYAETFDKRVGGDHWGPGKPRRVMSEHYWNEPLRWERKAAKSGMKLKVFCASMADVFDKEAPEGQRERLWTVIRSTPHLIWQLLTKRVEGYTELLPADLLDNPRIWKGFTGENQPWYDERWDAMRRLPGFTWLSYEPALGPLTLYKVLAKPCWVIFGGESGNNRRGCDPAWAERVMCECREYKIPFFVKQMSARTPAEGKLLIPEFLQIQEFPR